MTATGRRRSAFFLPNSSNSTKNWNDNLSARHTAAKIFSFPVTAMDSGFSAYDEVGQILGFSKPPHGCSPLRGTSLRFCPKALQAFGLFAPRASRSFLTPLARRSFGEGGGAHREPVLASSSRIVPLCRRAVPASRLDPLASDTITNLDPVSSSQYTICPGVYSGNDCALRDSCSFAWIGGPFHPTAGQSGDNPSLVLANFSGTHCKRPCHPPGDASAKLLVVERQRLPPNRPP